MGILRSVFRVIAAPAVHDREELVETLALAATLLAISPAARAIGNYVESTERLSPGKIYAPGFLLAVDLILATWAVGCIVGVFKPSMAYELNLIRRERKALRKAKVLGFHIK